jgi:hypothetical protein
MMKTNSALTPVVKLGSDVFGNKNNLSGPANEPVFFTVWLGSDKRKERGAVRGCNCYPAASAFKVVINDYAESKLVPVESQASILIANEDGSTENTEVGVLSVQAHCEAVRHG